MSTNVEIATKFLDAVRVADLETYRSVLAEDAEMWHNFDNHAQSVDENEKLMLFMRSKAQVEYEVLRLEEIEGGFLQQHILRLTPPGGETVESHACVVGQIVNGKIQRMDEYLDPTPLTKVLTG